MLEVLRDGLLKLRTATPWGLRPLITCLIVLSLPDASRPLQHDQQSELVVGGKAVLVIGEQPGAAGEQRVRLAAAQRAVQTGSWSRRTLTVLPAAIGIGLVRPFMNRMRLSITCEWPARAAAHRG